VFVAHQIGAAPHRVPTTAKTLARLDINERVLLKILTDVVEILDILEKREGLLPFGAAIRPRFCGDTVFRDKEECHNQQSEPYAPEMSSLHSLYEKQDACLAPKKIVIF
jgi:hypothetical protein